MDLDNPPETIWPTEDYFVLDEATGKYIWKCLRCKQAKEKFGKA